VFFTKCSFGRWFGCFGHRPESRISFGHLPTALAVGKKGSVCHIGFSQNFIHEALDYNFYGYFLKPPSRFWDASH